eukprot:CAMPEP_0201505046 /NCGR_PEP_ID=MMETSP0151_2-20130828/85552_1 /ASSEMBLY_ACC=CAM_ASM_000257 /TAXON_ID=200890 /ORGANISM="Paramoeba atlantica, Strain 621/1 / CCAP 1560/9" /LENGTH=33 /DNA_ID= /DNA_START= /DNA_END= /DNA_ORIENTATION=
MALWGEFDSSVVKALTHLDCSMTQIVYEDHITD